MADIDKADCDALKPKHFKAWMDFAKERGIPCVMNIWIPDGYKDIPAGRLGPRERFKKSLDEILSIPYDKVRHTKLNVFINNL